MPLKSYMAAIDGEILKYLLSFGERQRSYTVFRGSKLAPEGSYPLVIMLHGGGSSPALVM